MLYGCSCSGLFLKTISFLSLFFLSSLSVLTFFAFSISFLHCYVISSTVKPGIETRENNDSWFSSLMADMLSLWCKQGLNVSVENAARCQRGVQGTNPDRDGVPLGITLKCSLSNDEQKSCLLTTIILSYTKSISCHFKLKYSILISIHLSDDSVMT